MSKSQCIRSQEEQITWAEQIHVQQRHRDGLVDWHVVPAGAAQAGLFAAAYLVQNLGSSEASVPHMCCSPQSLVARLQLCHRCHSVALHWALSLASMCM